MDTQLKQNIKQGFKEAFVSRGKKKGMLKARCPEMNTMGAAVWQAVTTVANPWKISVGQIALMDKPDRAVYDYIVERLEGKDVAFMDRDAAVLTKLGLM